MDTAERPDLVERIRDATLHDVTCPRCRTAYTVDVPLLLYQPDRSPVLLFSPAGNVPQEQARQHAIGLVRLLQERLERAWRNEWVAGGLSSVPRQHLLRVLDVNREPPRSGAAGQALSPELVELIGKAEQAEQANDFNGTIRACQAALERISAGENGRVWGVLQMKMGNAFAQNPLVNRAENLEQAIACYRQALEVLTREALPLDWARI